MFDTTYNIPMIIKDPNSNRVNQQDDNLVYLHDLTSTVYDLANQPIPQAFEGESIFAGLFVNIKIINAKG